jgi:4-amino-4-deoxychorismate lyase
MRATSDAAIQTGVFETLAVVNAEPRLLRRHLARLLEGCRRLGLVAPPEDALAAAIAKQAASPGTGVVKCIVAKSSAEDSDADTQHWSVHAEPPRLRPAEWTRDGVSIMTCRTRLRIEPRLAGLKLLDRGAQVRARQEWTADSIAEGLMLDEEGRLISGTMTNVYAVIDGVICTPAVVRCGVAGVMRAQLLDGWRASGQPTHIRDMQPAELEAASEVFLSNALIGVWPVRALDGQSIPVGPIARAAGAWTNAAPPSSSA